jgi:hypothetical protein
MSAPGDMDIEQGILSPEAAKRQVSHISSSGYDFLPWAATAEILNINTLLKYCYLNHSSFDVMCCELYRYTPNI